MLVLSTIIVSLGLMLNNAAIVIGGMLVTPILVPILAISMGIVMTDSKVIFRSVRIMLQSLLIIFVVSIITTLITPTPEIFDELLARTFISIGFFYVALAAGIAAAFAWARPDLSEAMPGIAISVAVLPPLATVGIGIALWDAGLAIGGLKLFAANLLGIIIAATFVFSIMGFNKGRKTAQEEVKKEEKDVIKKEIAKVEKEAALIEEVQKEVNYNHKSHV